MGTHLRVLSESNPMNTNGMVFKGFSILVFWTKVASALEGITTLSQVTCFIHYIDLEYRS